MNKNTIIYQQGESIGPYGNIYIKDVGVNNSGSRKALFICPFCHKEYVGHLSSIKSGKQKGCKACGREKTTEARRLDLTNQTFGYLTALYPLEERKNGNVVWHCRCKCGNETDVIATELKNGYVKSCGCYSSEVNRKNNTLDITGKRYGKLVAIKNTWVIDEKSECFLWKFQCDCGNIKTLPICWVTCGNTTSCGCSKSKGETKIQNILTELRIRFIQQYSFEDCRSSFSSRKLYFDFFLPKYNMLIEYDGEQHFSANGRTWNTQQNLIRTKERDNIKNSYCLEKNIPLIRVPYTSFDKLDTEYISKLIERAQRGRGILYG